MNLPLPTVRRALALNWAAMAVGIAAIAGLAACAGGGANVAQPSQALV